MEIRKKAHGRARLSREYLQFYYCDSQKCLESSLVLHTTDTPKGEISIT